MEEKRHQVMSGKDVDVEVGNAEKDDQDNDSEDSQPEEETKMLDPAEPQERSKSKSSNKSSKDGHESDRRSREGRRSKYLLQDETILKHLFQESSDIKLKNDAETKEMYRKAGIGNLASNFTSYFPELTRLMQSEGQNTNAREMATQTSLSLDILEVEESKQSIHEIINSQHCSPKGTKISP
ncbi:uncharacterized protein LOC114881389 [Osmia bicornis bicornis]|uniref:uncharacterized protein LOC114881389 n=1 Tax=Osmia bicornis bicornis TaxID=1437191 RepID=UPI0010F86BAC|nr:uncharacterized protein LOC114881389 [Osmia bicornis bicornis]